MAARNSNLVVLLHGLGRTARSMSRLERALCARGYRVLNLGYASRSARIPVLARNVAERVEAWDATSQLHFVTHSLGGILVRSAVAQGWLPSDRIARVVMLGPPNAGSEVVDALTHAPVLGELVSFVSGPSLAELGTGDGSYVTNLPPVTFALGVVAGTRSFNPLFSAILEEQSDGKVRVGSTRVDGMSDFIAVPRWHPLLPTASDVIHQVVHFLECGRFDHSSSG